MTLYQGVSNSKTVLELVPTGTQDSQFDNLLSGISQRDQTALNRFYTRYRTLVYNFAYSKLKNRQDAKEIVNDVMFDVWRCAYKFEYRSKIATWLLGIANHKIVDKIRVSRRHRAVSINNDGYQYSDEVSAFDDIIECLQNQKRVKKALNKLSDNHRQVIYLVFYEELSYTDIAMILGCPVGTVKTRMMHAKKQLKKYCVN
jgi:RNA polymerase sigma-70 factor (ECF subfamily)